MPSSPDEAASVACPLCGGGTVLALSARDRNRETSGDSFRYRRCGRCRTLFLADVPADLAPAYRGDYHGIPNGGELAEKVRLERNKVDLVLEQVRPGTLVEVGPSFGAFAAAARAAGFSVTGVEMDAECCAHLRETVGVRAIHSAEPEVVLPSLAPTRAVCLWHVLEHVRKPLDLLSAAAGALEPGGVLAIAMPNPDALQLRLLGARWAHLDAPRHLFLIPLPTLLEHVSEHGLVAVATTTTDFFGRHCNRFGWEYALRRRPAARPSGPWVRRASQVLERLAAPAERGDLRGSAYTVLLRRPA